MIATKILANRITEMIGTLITKEQCRFIPGRSLVGNIIIAQETFDTINMDRTILSRMLIKVDIEKANDTLNWDTSLGTMVKMHFPSNWVSNINACLNSTSFSLLMNGSPTDWFYPLRGVRQGDPHCHAQSC